MRCHKAIPQKCNYYQSNSKYCFSDCGRCAHSAENCDETFDYGRYALLAEEFGREFLSATPTDKPVYTLFAGINGSGKTTIYNAVLPIAFKYTSEKTMLGVRDNADDMLQSNCGDWNCEKDHVVADKMMYDLVYHCIAKRINVNQETVLSGTGGLDNVKAAKDAGFFVRMVYVGVESPEISLDRIALRVTRGGHGIPEETVRKRYPLTLAHLKDAVECCDEVIVYDNSDFFKLVAYAKNGEFVRINRGVANWFDERY